MNMRTAINRVRFALLVGALLLVATNLVHGAVQDRIEKTFTVNDGGKLIMDVDRGSIEVKTTSENTLKVEVLRKVDKANQQKGQQILREHHVEFSQDGAEVRIHSEYAGDRFWNRGVNLQVRYLVTAPRKLNVELKTKGGSIGVSDLEGKAEVRTAGGNLNFGQIDGSIIGQTLGGSIAVAGCKEKVSVDTNGGNITIGDVDGTVSAKTLGGSIRIRKAKGDVVARTSGGNIDIAEVGGKVEATTLGGSVKASLTQQPSGDCVFKTSGGNIRVRLPENAAVDLDAKSNGGAVTTDFSVPNAGKPARTSLKTKLNGGGPVLVAHTSGGSVDISKR